jgi:hypothetical protein
MEAKSPAPWVVIVGPLLMTSSLALLLEITFLNAQA